MSEPERIVFTREQVKDAVKTSITQLFERDQFLLTHDASERAITHKLAEYLQTQFSGLNVDCEYNRNVEAGIYAQKKLTSLKSSLKKLAESGATEEELEEQANTSSTFPDIIVHHRGVNKDNLLVIEVKKKSSSVGSKLDIHKLKFYTKLVGEDPYHYRYGLFIEFTTKSQVRVDPKLRWFENGLERRKD